MVASARPEETCAPRLERRDLGWSGRHCDTSAAVLGSQNVVARLPLRAPAPRCRSRHPATLWSHSLHEDSNAWQGSTSRGRRCVGAIESGRTSVGGLAGEASCSHRAQGGFCVRPANGVGSLECLRLAFAGMGRVGRPGLDHMTCNMTKSHTRTNKASKDPRRKRRGFEGRWALRRHCPLRLHLPFKGSHLLCWGHLSPKPPNTDAIPPHRKQWGILA